MNELPLEHPRRGFRRWQVLSREGSFIGEAKMWLSWVDSPWGPFAEIVTRHHLARGYDAFEAEIVRTFHDRTSATFFRFEDAWEWANEQLSLALTAG